MDVEVIYPYEPVQDDELCLQIGDVITQVECLEKGWCKGVLNKVSGVFPDNFVRLITNNRKQMRPHDVSEMRPTQPTVEKRESGGRRCRVVFSYLPQHEDELTLNEGDVIDIMQEVEEGWWKGLLNGKVGMFPSNFVEVCEQGDEISANILNSEIKSIETNGNLHHSETSSVAVKKNEKIDLNGTATGILASPNSAFHPVQSARDNKDKDVNDGAAKSCLRTNGHDHSSSKSSKMQANAIEKERLDTFNDTDKITINIGDAKLKSLAKNSTSIPKPISVASPPQASPPQLPPKPVRELAKVLFPYSAEHDDELELVEGEIITILCKDLEDKGWWRGEMNGKSGVFPDNFVKIISSEETLVKPPRPEKRPNATPGRSSPPLVPNLTPISNVPKEIESTPPPPLPSKKVAPPPPPTEKKPHHQLIEDSSPIRNSICKTPLHDNLSDQGSLTLTRETPLPHVTRPKGPSNRRPPSQFLREPKSPAAHSDGNRSSDNDEDSFIMLDPISRDKEKEDHDETKHFNGFSPSGVDSGPLSPSTAEAQNVPWLKELRENQKKKRLSELFVPGDTESSGVSSTPGSPSISSTPIKTSPLAPASTKPSPPLSTKPQIPTATKTNLTNPVPHVREDLKINKYDAPFVTPTPAVRPNTGAPSLFSKTQDIFKNDVNGITEGTSLEEKIEILYKDVVPKMRSLELRFEEQQIMYSRQLKLLTKDLDDERKLRACLQIEVDRLKKLITTGYAQV